MIKGGYITKITRIFSIDTNLSEWLDTKGGANEFLNIILRQMFNIERDRGSSFVRNIGYNLMKLEEKNRLLNEKVGKLEKQKNQK